jgi:hypothetical protein
MTPHCWNRYRSVPTRQGSAQDALIFRLGDPHVASYESTCTTLINGVKFLGVTPPE